MKYRINMNWTKIGIQDASGTTAPTIFVEGDRNNKNQHRDAIAEAKERSGLSRFRNWNFR